MKNIIALIVGLLLLLYALATHRCNSCVAPAAVAVAAVPAAVSASYGAQIVLAGVLPDEASRAKLVQRAREMYGAEKVVDNLRIEAGAANAAWTGTDSLYAVLRPVGLASSSFDGKSLRLEGEVDRDATRTQLATEAAAALGTAGVVDNALTIRAPTESQSRIDEILRLKSVQFVSSRDQMTAAGLAVMREVEAVLKTAPDTRWAVAGHTDGLGDATMNQNLSEARAKAVIAWLGQRGFDAGRFSATGFGASRPIADNDTPAGRQRNRRIEFTPVGG